MRAISRTTGVARQTISDLLEDAGRAASNIHAKALVNLPCRVFECDEIWSFCYSKQKNVPDEFVGTPGHGNVWTWTAINAETKLVPTWLVRGRTISNAYVFRSDLNSRLRNARIQLTPDGLGHYLRVVDGLWADNIDFAMLHKNYGTLDSPHDPERTYSPATCTGIDVKVISGKPDTAPISTSHFERQNLTMRMGMRRFTRLTNGFSKKVEFHAHAVSLNFMYYNFARPHLSLRVKSTDGTFAKRTPAMAAGIADRIWSTWEIAELIDQVDERREK